MSCSDRPIMVSISCLTFNHAPYIRECLDGFLMQKTDFAFEVLIHDDASTDGTDTIIREYEAKYPDIIKPIYETENQWNIGRRGSSVFNFPRAKGKYIALCEGDDYWTDPFKLQKQVVVMESRPKVTMCFHNAIVHFEGMTSNRLVKNKDSEDNPVDYVLIDNLEEREYCFEETWYSWFHPTASWLIRREVLNSDLYKEMQEVPSINGDDKIRLTCAKLGNLYSLSSPMSVYRIHSSGVSQQFSDNFYSSFISEYYFLRILKLEKKYYRAFRKKCQDWFFDSVHLLFLNGISSQKQFLCAIISKMPLFAFCQFALLPFRVIFRLISKIES